MKKLMLVVLAGLLIMPLAAACGKGKRGGELTAYEQARSVFVNEAVYFDFDRYNIRSDAAAVCDAKVAFMNAYPEVRAEVGGHCDERGTEAYNMALGDRRAKAAYNYVVSKGLDASRLTTMSYGEERPADPSSNESAWARNRRAEFTLTYEGSYK